MSELSVEVLGDDSERVLGGAQLELPIEIVSVAGSMECGFQQMWMEGEGGGVRFSLTAGAGMGNPWMKIDIERDGVTGSICERIDMAAVLSDWVNAAIRRAEERES